MRFGPSLFVGLLILSADVAAQSQPPRMPRVGVMLMQTTDHAFPQAFRNGLRDLGYVEGKNIDVHYRTADGQASRLPAIAADFVKGNFDVIVAGGGSIGPRTAAKLTSTIPIVFPVAADPVGSGLIKSLARPGGNVTGLALLESEITAKRLQLLREILPKVRRVAVMQDPSMSSNPGGLQAIRDAARALGIEVQVFAQTGVEEIESAFKSARTGGSEAVLILASSTFARHSKRLVASAAENRLPTIWENRVYADAGGLISYGHDIADMYRSAARYVDKILKGARPEDLPVEQGTKLDLVINLTTAKTLRLTIPPTVLVRADEVIQ